VHPPGGCSIRSKLRDFRAKSGSKFWLGSKDNFDQILLNVDVIALLVVPPDPVFDAVGARDEVAACHRLAHQLLGAHGDNALFLLGVDIIDRGYPRRSLGRLCFGRTFARGEQNFEILRNQCDGKGLRG